ncbi:hypothetical protein Poli38472_011482 [Pythium oligandrum]|uniref:Peptidase S1 domain-containing protein n=1 Tax=Pythium oligandrum TaxID=41045 RepID=A0A8K1CLP2_PYTOL|nr:hypothetical protein Poli38472_011482 [Pythium oligandrum]|eukprot:TMW64602.1 hypothetical protein Poli38472_011482 [Pythium oligandrum]
MGAPVSFTTDNTGFIVSLRAEQRDPSFCMGSLIASRWVITAAHCLNKGKIRWVVVTAINSSKERKAGEIIEVERTIRHPKYRVVREKDQLMYNYDLLLVELRMSSVRTPIKMVNFNGLDVPQSIKQAKKATAFGLTLLNKAEVLRSVDHPLHYGKEKCNKLMQVKFTMPSDYVVCLGDKTTPKACLNDTASGGNPVILLPNTRTQRLLGVGSAGVACGYRKNYAMYTEISVNLQFIFQNVPIV